MMYLRSAVEEVNSVQGASEQGIKAGQPELLAPKKKRSSVVQRWLTALIAIPIVLVFVWFGGWFSFIAILAVLLLCLFELRTMFQHAGYHPLTWVSGVLSLLFLLAPMFPAQQLVLFQIGLSIALLLPFPLLFLRKSFEGALIDWALTLAAAIYLGWSFSCFLLLRGFPAGAIQNGTLVVPHGIWWLLLVLLGTWGTDSAAFFTGRLFGRHKLAPRVSPGKTWEGLIGGMVLAVIAALVFTVRPLGVPWYFAALLGLVLGVAAVLGDLAESLLKRQTNVKDSGQIMPGHGGMLDRVDSLLFVAIIVYLFSLFIR